MVGWIDARPAAMVSVVRLAGWREVTLWRTRSYAGIQTKGFHMTRLETRTKESSICANSRVIKPVSVTKVAAGIEFSFCTSNRLINCERFEYEHVC